MTQIRGRHAAPPRPPRRPGRGLHPFRRTAENPTDDPLLDDGLSPTPSPLDTLVRLAAFAVTALGIGGTPLLLVDSFDKLPVGLVAGAVFVAMEVGWRLAAPARRPARTWAVLVALAAVVGIGFAASYNVSHAGQHVYVDGDPAVYAITGQTLATTGTVTQPTHAADVFGNVASINYAGAGYTRTSDATVTPTFMHLLPEVLAVGSWADGLTGLLHTAPVLGALGLLAVFAFGARLAGPLPALVGTGALALLLPELFFSRETYSELPSQLLVFAGLVLLWDLTDPRRPARRPLVGGVLAGLVLAASTIARIDAYVYLVPVVVYAALLAIGALRLPAEERVGRTRLAAGLVVGLVLAGGMGAADLFVGSPVYRNLQSHELRQVWVALLAVTVLAVAAVALRGRLARWFAPALHQRRMAVLGVLAAALVGAGGAVGYWVRPHVEHGQHLPPNQPTSVGQLQKALGLPVQPLRSYDELTLHWLEWYVGPVTLVVAIVAVCWLLIRVGRGRDERTLAFLLVFAAATAVYVYRPSIIPVQFWAMRRFLPVTLPGLALLGAWLAGRLAVPLRARVVTGVRDWTLAPAGVGAFLGLGVLVGVAAWPVHYARTNPLSRYVAYDGMTRVTAQVCDRLGPHDAALILGQPLSTSFPQLVQAACRVPVAVVGYSTTADVQRVRAAVRAAGLNLVYLSPRRDPALPTGEALPDAPQFSRVASAVVPTQALTLMKRPDALYPLGVEVWASPAG